MRDPLERTVKDELKRFLNLATSQTAPSMWQKVAALEAGSSNDLMRLLAPMAIQQHAILARRRPLKASHRMIQLNGTSMHQNVEVLKYVLGEKPMLLPGLQSLLMRLLHLDPFVLYRRRVLCVLAARDEASLFSTLNNDCLTRITQKTGPNGAQWFDPISLKAQQEVFDDAAFADLAESLESEQTVSEGATSRRDGEWTNEGGIQAFREQITEEKPFIFANLLRFWHQQHVGGDALVSWSCSIVVPALLEQSTARSRFCCVLIMTGIAEYAITAELTGHQRSCILAMITETLQATADHTEELSGIQKFKVEELRIKPVALCEKPAESDASDAALFSTMW